MVTRANLRTPQDQESKERPMKQNTLYLLIGALLVAVIGLGVYVYREQTKPQGVELKIDDKGISIQQN
jgi:RsiW-degrading membrane proteinase PrsW (M82 family)